MLIAKQILVSTLALAAIVPILQGCGQTGALYLPPQHKQAAPPGAAAATPATPAASTPGNP